MSKLKLWTRQDERVLKDIETRGFYRVKQEHIIEKFDSCSDVYLHVYRWYARAASSVVPKPEGVEFPVWASVDKEFSLGVIEGQVVLELEVDRENVIIMDSAKWDYILNYWYIPKDSDDARSYDEKLETYGIRNKTLMYMNNFYPLLKREVEKSWERLFDNDIRLSDINQATLWEIRSEWITNVTRAE